MNQNRIFFLDNLRSAIILLVVVFHAALAYMIYAPEWWYVVDTKRVLSADIFVIWADIFIMPVMFFISGYFGIKSFAKRSQATFWKEKWKRIGLPWIFGAMVFAPHTAYLMLASRDIPMSFWDFYRNLFWGVAYQQSHYWYLGALMALYLLMIIVCMIYPELKEKKIASKPSGRFIFGLGILGAIGVGVVNLIYSDGVWIHPLYLLVLQPTRVPLYLIYFALGIYAYRKQWFTQMGYSPCAKFWIPAFILMSIVYTAHKLLTQAIFQLSPTDYLVLNATLHSFFCLASVFGLLSLFKVTFDYTTPIWATLSATSYPIYYVHQTIVQEMNWAVRPMDTNAFVKYAIVCIVSLTLCYLIGKFVLLKIPAFGPSKRKSINM